MTFLGTLFVQNPAGIFLVSGIFFVAYLLLRTMSWVGRTQPLLWAALAWAIWAAWEFLVLRSTPEADIRVDLLLIIPVVIGLSIAAVVLLFVKKRGTDKIKD